MIITLECNHCGKETEETNYSGIKKVNCDWCKEPLRNNSQKKPQQYIEASIGNNIEASIGNNEVVVTDIRMSFGSMVLFQVKWIIAAIPAAIILCLILIAIFFGLGLFGLGIKNLYSLFY